MQTKTLGEICRPKQWKTVATSQLSEEGYPVYGANGIIGKYKEYNHENETILVTCRGATCGALNICEPFSYVNGNAMALDNLDQSIDLKYLYYFLKGRGFHDVISGSAQPQIIRSAIERIEVPICDIETQKEITKSFAKIEKLIESKKKILANLDNLIKARFVEMFGGSKYPSKTIKGILSESFWLMPATPKYIEKGIPYITSKNIKNRVLDFSDTKFISEDDYLKISKNRPVKPGDILVSMIGTLGQTAIVPEDKRFYGQNVYLLRLDNRVVNTAFFCEFFNSDDIQNKLTRKSNQSTQAYLKANHVEDLLIPIAPMEIQKQFAAFVAQVDKSKFALGNELTMGDFYIRLIYDRIMHGCIDL